MVARVQELRNGMEERARDAARIDSLRYDFAESPAALRSIARSKTLKRCCAVSKHLHFPTSSIAIALPKTKCFVLRNEIRC